MTFLSLFRAWPCQWLLLSVVVSFGATLVNSSPLVVQTPFSVDNPSMFNAQKTPLAELIHQKHRGSCTDDSYISQTCIQTLTIPLEPRSLLHVTGRKTRRRRKTSLFILEHLIRGTFFPIFYLLNTHTSTVNVTLPCDSQISR